MKGASGKAQETVEFGANLVTDPGNNPGERPQRGGQTVRQYRHWRSETARARRDTVGEQLLNVSDAKRKIAYDLGVDVYSSNRVLQNEWKG